MQPLTVALFIFNRPQHTRRVFEAIAAARPARLLVVADGPRPGRPEEPALCEAARTIVEAVDWPCRVETHFAAANLGCKRRVASGLEWIFARADEAVILEDDTVPHASFFRFCQELLERYRHDPRVFMIRGARATPAAPPMQSSYYFSRFYAIWGWASWARAFRHYDLAMQRWPELRASGWLERLLPTREMRRVMRFYFDHAHSGAMDSWEFQWEYSGWLQNALAIAPTRNLVTNIGFDADATHLRNAHDPSANMPAAAMTFPLVHPPDVAPFDPADRDEWAASYPGLELKRSYPVRAYRRLRAAAARIVHARRRAVPDEPWPSDLSAADRAIVEAVRPHSMTSPLRIESLVQSVRYCTERGVPGAFVECGVWRGGSVLAMIRQLLALGVTTRDLYLFDTFEGMTQPTAKDVSLRGERALDEWRRAQRDGSRMWSEAFGEQSFSEASVRELLGASGYPVERLHFVRGKVEDTLAAAAPAQIALLRLDTDWYESTRCELEQLYPRLAPGGVLILDDYGHWAGARRAVDEYFARPDVPKVLLQRIDYTGRLAIKT